MSTEELEALSVPHDVAPPEGVPAPGLYARLALWIVLAVVVVHSAAVALWVAPPNLLRQAVGPERLRAYVLPMWDQAWSVFAPEADYAYDLFEVRATVRNTNGSTRTGWVKVTAREVVPNIRHHPFPSRTGLASTRIAGQLLGDSNALSSAQRQVVQRADQQVSVDALEGRLLTAATNDAERAKVAPFVRSERVAEYFLSGIAHAIWGDRLEYFQFRTNKIAVPSYSGSVKARQVVGGYSSYSNWRVPHSLTAADKSAFGAYVHEFGIR